MSFARGKHAGFEREADSIERVLNSLALPLRVRGGEIREGRVRFRLSEQAHGRQRELRSALGAVAAALGAPRVELAQRGTSLDLEVEAAGDDALRLLPLLDLLGELPPMHLGLGMGLDGRPLVIDFSSPSSWNLVVLGELGSGKSDLLRSALVSLAAGTAPRDVRVLGIDLTGREQRLLEALPHALCELADEPRYADELLDWLASEAADRREPWPQLFLWVDDVGSLAAAGLRHVERRLRGLLRIGSASGVHLVLAGREIELAALLAASRDRAVHAHASRGRPGSFLFSSLRGRCQAQVAWLPAADLNSAVQLVEAQWLGSELGGKGLAGRPAAEEGT